MGDGSARDRAVAIVTGATQAMGEAIARRLARNGVAVLGVGRDDSRGRAVAARIVADGFEADFVATDVGKEDEVARAVEAVVERFGGLDIVVNNAASLDAWPPEAPVHLEPTDVFDSILRVNLYGPFWFVKYGAPVMIAGQRGGLFVNISSYAAHRGVAGKPAYTASKGALEALTRQVAVDYAEYGIRANTLVLGSIGVPRNAALHDDPDMAEAMRAGRLVHRAGTPDDTAAAVAFLASPDAGFITGTTLNVDGGLLAKAAVPRVAQRLAEATAVPSSSSGGG
ncbi:SDR family NAD(P)-dependent oxidoreductase [uncultured Jatrophihabitans sp.]|uniref:SDR family NAD(P)-dependent oxidoreductase n=1 Tax=uncultured Jatrophihabitans sp. TaxID=1610747 RepID=UPI0035CB8286